MRLSFLFVLFLALFVSCQQLNLDDEDADCDYSTCNGIEPFSATLNIYFTRNPKIDSTVIFVLSGYFEDFIVLDTISIDTIPDYRTKTYIVKDIGHYYTIVAQYIIGKDTFLAVDGNELAKKSYYECDSLCWKVTGENFNVKLKGYKSY